MDHGWDNQLDTMLDDLHASVQNNSFKSSQTTKRSESTYLVSEQRYYTSTVSENLLQSGSQSLVSDLSSIEKVKSVNKTNERPVSTQQSLKKNINDLDYLLSNLSSHSSSKEVSPTLHKNGEKNTKGKPGTTLVVSVAKQEDTNTERNCFQKDVLHRSSSFNKNKTEFFPVHTTPDPLTGRYADGRITPNHGFTRNFNEKQVCSQNTQTDTNGNIPKKPDDLLQCFGQVFEQSELDKIKEIESEALCTKNVKKEYVEQENSEFVPCRPIFYPTEEMYDTTNVSSYQAQKGSANKKNSEEKSGAAVIPICLPLCCAAPCVIM